MIADRLHIGFRARTVTGFAAFWAWVDNVFFLTTATFHEELALPLPKIHACVVIVSLLTGIAIAKSRRRLSPREGHPSGYRRLAEASGACAIIGSMLLSLPGLGASPQSLGAAIVLCGIGMGGIGISWGLRFTLLDTREACLCSSGGIALSFLFNMLLKNMLAPTAAIGACLMPCLTAVCLRAVPSSPEDGSAAGGKAPRSEASAWRLWASVLKRIPSRILIAVAVFTLAYEVLQNTAVAPSADAAFLSGMNLASRGLTAAAVCLGLLTRKWTPRKLFKFGFFLIAVSLMAFPLGVDLRLSSAVFVTGYTLCDIMVWTILGSAGTRWPEGSFVYASSVWIIERLGIVAGMAVSAGIFAARLNTDAAYTALAYIVLVMAVMTLDRGNFRLWEFVADADPDTESASLRLRVEEVACVCKLTVRESEILLLLVEGRSAPWIASHLCIADGTVKVHVRHIYEKCGVHSKQELIDFVRKRDEAEEG
ncbi:LuxR C-terminal-related transcriptional regulator [Rubneribacter sp.]